MSDEARRAEIEERLSKATPEFWQVAVAAAVAPGGNYDNWRANANVAIHATDDIRWLLDRLAEVEARLDATEAQIHEPGGFIDETVDLTERLSGAEHVAEHWQKRAEKAEAALARVRALVKAEDARVAEFNSLTAPRSRLTGMPYRISGIVGTEALHAALDGEQHNRADILDRGDA